MPVIEGIEGGSDQKSCHVCRQFNPNSNAGPSPGQHAWASGNQSSCIRSTPRIWCWNLTPIRACWPTNAAYFCTLRLQLNEWDSYRGNKSASSRISTSACARARRLLLPSPTLLESSITASVLGWKNVIACGMGVRCKMFVGSWGYYRGHAVYMQALSLPCNLTYYPLQLCVRQAARRTEN